MNLVVSKIQIWGGSRNRPKLLGREIVMGIEKNGWLFPVSEADQAKYLLKANKVEMTRHYNDYKTLTKEFPQFSAMKRAISKKFKQL